MELCTVGFARRLLVVVMNLEYHEGLLFGVNAAVMIAQAHR